MTSTARSPRALRWIAAFKLLKGLVLLAAAAEALRLLQPAALGRFVGWLYGLPFASGSLALNHLATWLVGTAPWHLGLIGALLLLYAALYTVEGIGLWRGLRWAEYLTVVATSLFVPLEIYEIVRHATWPRCAALLVNVAIIVYLVRLLRRQA